MEPIDDLCFLAKTYFDLKEYRRAAHALVGATSWHAIFLRNYALYLAGEKSREEELFESKDLTHAGAGASFIVPPSRDTPITAQSIGSQAVASMIGTGTKKPGGAGPNRELVAIERELEQLAIDRKGLDGFCYFLYGLVLRALGQPLRAVEMLVAAVNVFPLNWSAWKTLAALCTDMSMVNALKLEPHFMREFFVAEVLTELHQHRAKEIFGALTVLDEQYPSFTHVLSSKALAHYNLREFDAAQALFEELRVRDPFRIDNMGTYFISTYLEHPPYHDTLG
jgi:anaphase-promoting complex subunit 8